jgi:hypothetical protein
MMASAALALGCGEDDRVIDSTACNSVADCAPNQICVNSRCAIPAAGDTTTNPDTAAPDVPGVEDAVLTDSTTLPDVVTADTTPIKDVAVPFDPGPAPDLIPDDDPPTLKTTVPAKDAVGVANPWTLVLTFSEPVKNIEDNTVQVRDIGDVPLKATFTSDAAKTVWTYTPTTPLMVASPYTATVNAPLQVIADLANNKFAGITEFQFFTAAPKNREKYATLASTYAPTLRVILGAKPNYDMPTALDLDKDFDLKNNKAHLDKTTTKELTPTVYWDVAESESHYYLHYAWYFSGRNGTTSDFQNDASGALVILEKWPAPRPVEVITWFKNPGGEYLRAFVTTESGISAGDPANEYITGVYSQAELFPGDKVEIAITPGEHESCLWNSEGTQTACDLPLGDRLQFAAKTVVMNAGAAATPYKKAGAAWPTTNEGVTGKVDGAVSYALADMLSVWWPRRSQTTTMFNDSFTTYSYSDAGKAKIAKFPRYFVAGDGTQSPGRAPWALVWKPGDNSSYQANMPAGQFFLDPATHLVERHDTAYTKTAFDETAKTGFSAVWCLNAYFNVDARGSSDACPN